MMKILVLGSNGQVGGELVRAQRSAMAIVGTLRAEVDFAKPQTIVDAVARHRPDVVINATAYTAVDKAETDTATAFAVNATGVEALGAATAAAGVPVLHISTDYVFDGKGTKPYVETDPIAPLSVYGKSKAAGEAALRGANPRHIILRTSWVYASHGNNFVKTMLRLGRGRPEVRVVADQFGAPTSAADIADALLTIAAQISDAAAGAPWGTYHFANAGETTWHGFAEHIFADMERRSGRRPLCFPIGTVDYPTPARRPENSRLDCSLTTRTFAIAPAPWQQSLDIVLAELAAQQPSA